ncbi:MAG TPA: J domain-containing protein [Candidatus Methylomirabilis sp.]|nr:J domain-containing protein [Candidatus Methylomirabilis sp.]
MKRDYYGVLGVATSATPAQIRRAYQRLARQYSPDVNLWEQHARGLFEEVVEAYRVLSNPMARTLYDRGAGQPSPERVTGSGQAVRSTGRRGDDLLVPLEISFQQAVSGFQAEVPVDRLSICVACEATGSAHGGMPAPCPHCDGAGTVWHGHGALETSSCPACSGSGVRVSDPCPGCRGRGVAPSRSVVRVILPAGIDTGTPFRIPGEGHAGPFGGPRGELVVMPRVHDDPVFVRRGDNLYCEATVTIAEAVLGARVGIPAIEGESQLSIPPGTQSGQVFRVRGKGVPHLSGDGRGDLYATVRVEIPRGLDSRAQELFRELARLLPGHSRSGARPESST